MKKKTKTHGSPVKTRSVPRPAAARRRAGPKPTASAAPATKAAVRGGEPGTVGALRIRPLGNRLLVRRIEETEARAGRIIVPDTAKEKPQQAEVVAVGSGRLLKTGERVPLTIRRGDTVLVGKWSGTEVKLAGQELLILTEDEVLGILS